MPHKYENLNTTQLITTCAKIVYYRRFILNVVILATTTFSNFHYFEENMYSRVGLNS